MKAFTTKYFSYGFLIDALYQVEKLPYIPSLGEFSL